MDDRQQREVMVYVDLVHHQSFKSVADLVAFISKVCEQVLVEAGKVHAIVPDTVEYKLYGDDYGMPELAVTYKRYETDEEYAARLKREGKDGGKDA